MILGQNSMSLKNGSRQPHSAGSLIVCLVYIADGPIPGTS